MCGSKVLPFVLGTLLIVGLAPARAEDRAGTSYSPNVGARASNEVFWGDTHLHTSLSVDAYAFGNRSIGPQEAYRFAKGEVVTGFNGMPVRPNRPLDFLVIADHAEDLGLLREIDRGNAKSLAPEKARSWSERFSAAWNGVKNDPVRSMRLWQAISASGFNEGNVLTEQARNSIWQGLARLADAENQPGRFTAFISYEWTQWNEWLHRVVICRDDAHRAERALPFTAFDSSDPEDLWAWMEQYERRTGGQVLAIPHNSNLTSGTMFALETARGAALTADYARTRQRWEPLLEVTQAKGDSETHPQLSPADEFADFERISMPRGARRPAEPGAHGPSSFDGWHARFAAQPTTEWMRPFEYARSGLKLGLEHQARLGTNPFKFGMAGGTDMHTGLATTDEDNFWGASSSLSGPHPDRVTGPWLPHSAIPGAKRTDPGQAGWTMSAAGLTAVWAEANTREALFAAMKRRETYATTGPRIVVRFFGGWNFDPADAVRPDLAALGYRKGVPMGGDLSAGPQGRAPTFLIGAARDPQGANLDRVQVVKGWRRPNGDVLERVYDVALADARRPDAQGKVPPVGNTVDVSEATYTNSIGDPELSIVWRDPDFDPSEPAFYYVRVIEIPTPKWTAFDARFFGIRDLPREVPMTTQERAYTSPIWYTPVVGQPRLPRDSTAL
jgi:hypothetical protein